MGINNCQYAHIVLFVRVFYFHITFLNIVLKGCLGLHTPATTCRWNVSFCSRASLKHNQFCLPVVMPVFYIFFLSITTGKNCCLAYARNAVFSVFICLHTCNANKLFEAKSLIYFKYHNMLFIFICVIFSELFRLIYIYWIYYKWIVTRMN